MSEPNESENLNNKLGSPGDLFQYLSSILRSDGAVPALSALAALQIKQKIDFADLAIQSIEAGVSCFEVAMVMEKAALHLEVEVDSYLSLQKRFYDEMGNDSVNGLQYASVSAVVSRQPKKAKELLFKLLGINDPFISGLISRIYLELSKGNETAVHSELISHTKNSNENVVIGAISGLARLNYRKRANRQLLSKTIEVFDHLLDTERLNLRPFLVFGYNDLADISKKCFSKIAALSKLQDADTHFAISRVLILRMNDCSEERWFRKSLEPMIGTSYKFRGTIDNLDYVLAGIVKSSTDPKSAVKFLEDWIVHSDYPVNSGKMSKLFGSTFSAILENRKLLSYTLTAFFNHDNYRIHRAAADLVNYCNLMKIQELNLDKQFLKAMSPDDTVYICRKILGHVFEAKALRWLIYSVLDASPSTQRLRQLVENVMVDQIGKEYPTSTIEYLKLKSKTGPGKYRKLVASNALKKIRARERKLRALPRLEFLVPPTSQSRQVERASRASMSMTMNDVQKESPFLSVVTHIHLKYGNGSFSYINGSYTPVSKLSEFSTSIELPRSEISHSVLAALQRIEFRQVKRGE